MLEDYAESLTDGGFDITDVRIACRNWRDGENRRMPSPGELLAYCRRVFNPARYGEPVNPLALLPAPFVRSEAELEQMRRDMKALSDEMAALGARRHIRRFQGESEVDVARRLWPNREVS